VIPEEGVTNPGMRPIIDLFEIARRNNRLARLDVRPVVQMMAAPGYSQGGYVSGNAGTSAATASQQVVYVTDPDNKAMLKELTGLLKKGIKAEINKYGTNSLDESLRDIESFNKKTFRK
jgi:hypothetical protein